MKDISEFTDEGKARQVFHRAQQMGLDRALTASVPCFHPAPVIISQRASRIFHTLLLPGPPWE
jgi:hypothetical protein